LGEAVKFFRFGILSVLQSREISLQSAVALIGVVLSFANAVVFQLFVSEHETDSPTWRADLKTEGLVYVVDGRVAVFWAIAVVSLLLIIFYLRAVAFSFLALGAWATVIDPLIFSNIGGQDVLRQFAEDTGSDSASLMPLYILTGFIVLAGVFLAVWPNRDFFMEKYASLTGGEKTAILLLLANAFSYQFYLNQINADSPNWRTNYGVEEALYTTEGRVALAWALAGIGILAFFALRRVLKWLLLFHWLWALFLDQIIQGTIGGEDVWKTFGQFAPYNAIQQLQGLIGLLIAVTAIWLFTGWYRNRLIAWMDKKGAEITKDSENFDHTSPLAIIAIILAFLFPIGGLVLAAIAKREIALAKSNVGGINLVVAANITAVVILTLQAFVLLTIGFDLIELAFFVEELFPSE
jgi:hypothetical protein